MNHVDSIHLSLKVQRRHWLQIVIEFYGGPKVHDINIQLYQ